MAEEYPNASVKDDARQNRVRDRPDFETDGSLNHEHERIRTWLKQVRFKRKLFGGVDEADLWRKLGELNTMYEAALSAERARYDALLAVNGKAGGQGETQE